MNFNNFPKKVKIVEVGPRDGLQNEKTNVPSEIKIQFIKDLVDAGLKTIEATSFVRADRIPQLADAKTIYAGVSDLKVDLPCLVPNMKGFEIARSCDVDSIAVFTATSNEFNKRNINATVEESLDKIKPVLEKAKAEKLKIRAYISTVFGCPYEGMPPIENLHKIMDFVEKYNVDEFSLGDTIGVATPAQVDQILTDLKKRFDLSKVALHFHDTRSMALTNVLIGLEHGISIYDSSAAGLGGCPYAKGATGNLATEDLVYLLESHGIETGVNQEKLVKASMPVLKALSKNSESKNHHVIKGK